VRDVLFAQETMDIQEIMETVDIADGREGATISCVLMENGGKKYA